MRFGGVTAVADVDFTLGEVELRCLIGPNGAGKSTFFKILTGQLKPSEGKIRLRDTDITGAEPHAIARLGVGIKTQVPNVFNGLTVHENVFVAAGRRKSAARTRAIVEETLTRLALTGIAGRIVGQLAHGQRQWVEIATVLAQEPELILLDEPAAGMTHDEVHRTAELIREINRTHALIVVEHDMPFIRMIAKTVTVFNQGRILVEDRWTRCWPIPACGMSISASRRPDMVAAAPPLLSVEGLHSGYGRIPILDGVTLSVRAGEFVGILGHNGMGKTTLLRTLMGYLPATAGHVRFEGADITRRSPTARAQLGLGYVPQGREIFPALSVHENLRMGCLLAKRGEDETIADILTTFPRLKAYLNRPGGALSGGEQQLLALARCLCGDPRILLLDEPTEGIQPSIIEEIIETLQRIGRERGIALLLVEQNLNCIAGLSERILILQKGTITREVPPEVARDRALIDEFVGMA